jgi:hypothetical protein
VNKMRAETCYKKNIFFAESFNDFSIELNNKKNIGDILISPLNSGPNSQYREIYLYSDNGQYVKITDFYYTKIENETRHENFNRTFFDKHNLCINFCRNIIECLFIMNNSMGQ